MSVRHPLAAAATALVGGAGLATPAAAQIAVQPAAASFYTMSSGRLGAIVAGLAGLIGVIVGGLALARARRAGTGQGRRATVAMVCLLYTSPSPRD